ncbi:MAG: DUF3263 domain-containing protein [Cryobacterium sp.]|nr:DUF3263 domain-containing protein [Cryobacterium sp.]
MLQACHLTGRHAGGFVPLSLVARNIRDVAITERLSERYERVLEFERTAPTHRGSKERAIRSQFHLSAARYYQILNAAIDSPAALAYDPLLVTRLRRVRAARSTSITTDASAQSRTR